MRSGRRSLPSDDDGGGRELSHPFPFYLAATSSLHPGPAEWTKTADHTRNSACYMGIMRRCHLEQGNRSWGKGGSFFSPSLGPLNHFLKSSGSREMERWRKVQFLPFLSLEESGDHCLDPVSTHFQWARKGSEHGLEHLYWQWEDIGQREALLVS